MRHPMGSSVSDPYGSLAEAPARFDASTDLTLAIEEEFQILDRGSLSLRNGFRELHELAVGTPLEEHLAGELIECEVEVKTGRCETFAEAARLTIERRHDEFCPFLLRVLVFEECFQVLHARWPSGNTAATRLCGATGRPAPEGMAAGRGAD